MALLIGIGWGLISLLAYRLSSIFDDDYGNLAALGFVSAGLSVICIFIFALTVASQ
jgi:hypothetical protein